MRNQCWTKSMYWNRGDIPRWNRKLVLKTCYKFVGYSMFFVDASSRNSAANSHLQPPPTLHDEFALSLTEIFIELHMRCYALYQMKQKSHVKRARNCCNGRIRPTSSNFVQVRPTSSKFVQLRPNSSVFGARLVHATVCTYQTNWSVRVNTSRLQTDVWAASTKTCLVTASKSLKL